MTSGTNAVRTTKAGLVIFLILFVLNCAAHIILVAFTFKSPAQQGNNQLRVLQFATLGAAVGAVLCSVLHAFLLFRCRKAGKADKMINIVFSVLLATLGFVQFVVCLIRSTALLQGGNKDVGFNMLNEFATAYVSSMIPALTIPFAIGIFIEPIVQTPPGWLRGMELRDRINPTWENENAARMERAGDA